MAEPTSKRHREVDGDTQIDTPKRHRNPYINDQQPETTQDLLDFLTSLSSDIFLDFAQHPEPDPDNHNPRVNTKEELIEEDDEKERVIRHLLEASDDELGIPSRAEDGGEVSGDGGGDGGGGDDDVDGAGYGDFSCGLCDGLWDLEDEAANYDTLLQSELFMQ